MGRSPDFPLTSTWSSPKSPLKTWTFRNFSRLPRTPKRPKRRRRRRRRRWRARPCQSWLSSKRYDGGSVRCGGNNNGGGSRKGRDRFHILRLARSLNDETRDDSGYGLTGYGG